MTKMMAPYTPVYYHTVHSSKLTKVGVWMKRRMIGAGDLNA